MNAVASPGVHMRAEIAEAPGVFATTLKEAIDTRRLDQIASLHFDQVRAIYTIARGSSDAAANILSYEVMRETGKPMTSLPPSIFSVGRGVDMAGSVSLIVSQSGGSDDLVRSAYGIREAGGGWLG